jgi:cell division transport system permease protein
VIRFRLILSEALKSIGANLSTTFASAVSVLIGMFLIGAFIGLGTWLVSWSEDKKRELAVHVYFCSPASENPSCVGDPTNKQINEVRAFLASDARIKEGGITFITKPEALKILRKQAPELTENLATNPLPVSFDVVPAKGEDTEAILLAASTILIANTIRLSIFARRREIEVMKLVGATNWFVRGPFMLEGLLTGLAGSLAAVVLLFLTREVAMSRILQNMREDPDVHALGFTTTAALLLATGLAIGAAGSGLTLRRFLRV